MRMSEDRLNFRAWHAETKGYYYFNIYDLRKYSLDEYDDDDIEQCTGLEDKNSHLIYENDFIQAKNGNIYLIEWCQEKLGFVARTNNPDDTLESLDISLCEWEIVGNIHENEDLLRL